VAYSLAHPALRGDVEASVVTRETHLDIYTLDLNFLDIPRVIASYLVVGPEGPVLVETGPGSTLGTLTARLAEHGFAPGDIRHVLVTHIHLDHAGAAGWWARQGAQVYVHHVGAPHLIDPSKLLASAQRIYGDMLDRLWGEVLPSPVERVTPLYDDEPVRVCGLAFTALDTPGHARHHHVYRLGDVAFAGDAAGIRLPGSPLVFAPTPPPEFDLEAWQHTLARLLGENFAAIYPTHFGRIDDANAHLKAFNTLLHESAEFVRQRLQAGVERDALVGQYTAWNRRRADALNIPDEVFHHYEATNPLFMAVDGLVRYWKKKAEEPNE